MSESFILRDRDDTVLVRDPKPEPRWKPALHSGAEVEPFRTRWRGGRLYIPDDRELLRRVYKSGFDLQRYERPKLFLRQTGDQLVSARDRHGLLCLNNVHILASKTGPPIDLRFLCGLLLSETMQRYYQAIALEAGRPLAQVDLATVRTLPYPCDANGAPYGICLEPQQELQIAQQIGERIDAALEARRTGEVVSILREAIGYEQVGRVLVTAAICRLVEILENQRDPASGEETKTALDIGIALLFGIDMDTSVPEAGTPAEV